MSSRRWVVSGLVVWALCIAPTHGVGQTRPLPSTTVVAVGPRTRPITEASLPRPAFVTAVAGRSFEAGAFHQWLLGPHYRDVWTTPVAVELLDLDTTAGGLTPFESGGGMQTRSLRFRGGDGREYAFRSVAKDPLALLDPILRGTMVEDLLEDGISAAHPYGALVAAPLLDAAGVLHVDPRLAILPTDPRLGPFGAEFAGMLGILEERPDENDRGCSAFAAADRVIGSERLTERMDEGPMDRVDARAYLRAAARGRMWAEKCRLR